MFALTERALQIMKGQSFSTPVDLLDNIFPEVYAYGQKITSNPNLRKTFALNALVGTDNAAWLLYAKENGFTTFDQMIPKAYQPALSNHHSEVAAIPLMAYNIPINEIQAAVEQGYFFMKIKIGQPGTQEEMLEKDKEIEAVYIATDAPSHVRLCIASLKRGLHVVSAVPAVFGVEQLEFADELLATVKKTGLIYALNETSAFRSQCYAMREIDKAGGFGKMIYTEGEYFHYMPEPIGSYKEWRVGLPPQYYPTHSNAFYTCVTGGTFTDVSCLAMPSLLAAFQPGKNRYGNRFATEVALFRTSEGGMARMAVGWDMPGVGGEKGRVYGQKGCYEERYSGLADLSKVSQDKPQLPPKMSPGGHGGSHGYLTDDFITAILLNRKPCVDVACALNTTVPGIIAHQSALKGGETLKIPQYTL